ERGGSVGAEDDLCLEVPSAVLEQDRVVLHAPALRRTTQRPRTHSPWPQSRGVRRPEPGQRRRLELREGWSWTAPVQRPQRGPLPSSSETHSPAPVRAVARATPTLR